MKKNIPWLLKELDLWVQEGLINQAQAQAICGRYPGEEESGSWGRLAFGVFGAILIGLGVILLFAYNWDKMHKFAKLAVIFTALISAHVSGLVVRRRSAQETLHVLGTMFFGAGIWLVAQIYHIQEHYPTAFLVWGIGALSLAWIRPSLAQGLIATLLLVLWSGFEFFGFQNPVYAAPVLVLFGVLPLAGVLRSRVLAAAGLASFLFLLFSVFQRSVWGSLLAPTFFFTGASLIASGLVLRRYPRVSELAPICASFGNVLYFFMLFAFSFRGVGVGLSYAPAGQAVLPGTGFALLLFVALGLWATAIWPFKDIRERLTEDLRPDYLAVPAVLFLYSLQFFGIVRLEGLLTAAPYNLLILFSAVVLMLRGFRTLQLRTAIMGSLLLTALAMVRYTDLFQSLLARGAVFLAVGGMLIGIGVFFARARSPKEGGK